MAGRGTNISRNFDALKKRGMSDSEAMEKAIGLSSASTMRERKSHSKKLKRKSTSKLRMAVTGKLKRGSHSPAGRKNMGK